MGKLTSGGHAIVVRDPASGNHERWEIFRRKSCPSRMKDYDALDSAVRDCVSDKGCMGVTNDYFNTAQDRPQSNSNWAYLGCYSDNGGRDFKHGPRTYGYDANRCRGECTQYQFFALQDGGWCQCDNSYATPSYVYRKKPDYECNKGGTGRGGGWRNAVYTTQPSRTPPSMGTWYTCRNMTFSQWDNPWADAGYGY